MRGKDELKDRPEVQAKTHWEDRQTLPVAQSQVHGGELQGKHQARGPDASQELLFWPEQQRYHSLDHRIELPDCLGQHGEGEVIHRAARRKQGPVEHPGGLHQAEAERLLVRGHANTDCGQNSA